MIFAHKWAVVLLSLTPRFLSPKVKPTTEGLALVFLCYEADSISNDALTMLQLLAHTAEMLYDDEEMCVVSLVFRCAIDGL